MVEEKIIVENPDAPKDNGGQQEHALPTILPVLPLSDVVLFPGMVAPLIVSTTRSMKLIDDVASGSRFLIAVLQRNRMEADDAVDIKDLFEYGCLARLIKMLKFPDDTVRILVQGLDRCKIARKENTDQYLAARYAVLKDENEPSIELSALTRNASQRFQEIITLSPALPEELKIALFNIEDSGKMTDLIAAHLNMSLEDRQALLEDYRPKSRLTKLTTLLNRELEVLRLGTEIQHKVSETFTKSQRDFFLREQLKTIKKELGEDDQQQMDLREMEEKIVKAKMPKDVEEAARKEKDRLATMPTASPEYAVVRTYLEWMTELPWSIATEDMLDIPKARDVLDRDHYDLKKIKDRILEYLSVLKLKPDMKGPILCFVGPPGVGKTSLGQSIAHALGRKFVRISLGGVRDEAEIRGHRRTYIGALPGRVIQGLRKAGTRNPVFMLDEIDKLGMDFRGDPSSALLEVLDPEQNSTFSDHYLNVAFDLSRVIFITTANMLDPIPPALRDRMEVLELPGYTQTEKIQIAKKYLLPRQIKAHGLTRRLFSLAPGTLSHLISDYTREAGVRNLEREIANLCRKVARNVAEGKNGKHTIKPSDLHRMLGPRTFESEVAEETAEAGVVTGLAWTPAGGDILFIEATQMPGKGDLILTGSLGDVMKESARAALSYIEANAAKWKLPVRLMDKTDIHVHVPAGSIPKDGPSAGVAMVMALYSMIKQKPVPADLAMTGEITLRGKVMPVGGIKEKVLAASRAGIKQVLLPERNRLNLEEIPLEVQRKIKFKFVQSLDDVIKFVEASSRNGSRVKKGKARKGGT
ncbi:MAG TPA: endopeptidase La [Verrucomicrobia bacterium]|nr:MAG: endopeptidase La [Lentisphaerae bacterium GWF2_57_35]HBA84009.1 endopeptidase La [Verrucomicrobiota bacterium]